MIKKIKRNIKMLEIALSNLSRDVHGSEHSVYSIGLTGRVSNLETEVKELKKVNGRLMEHFDIEIMRVKASIRNHDRL